MSGMGMIIYIVALFAFLYFLLIRPQKKHQNNRNQMLNNLKINDRVLTVGGLTGYIRQKTDDFLYIEIADGLVVEVSRQYVASVLPDEDDTVEEAVEAPAQSVHSDDDDDKKDDDAIEELSDDNNDAVDVDANK